MRVLVIDDNEDTAFLHCELAKACGCEARFCTIATVSVEVAREWQPNIIFLDLAIPDIDGYRLAPMLRDACNPNVPRILLISGYVPTPESLAAATIDGHLLKPASFEELQQLLPC
jgi:CheY-like chemotaxis protein